MKCQRRDLKQSPDQRSSAGPDVNNDYWLFLGHAQDGNIWLTFAPEIANQQRLAWRALLLDDFTQLGHRCHLFLCNFNDDVTLSELGVFGRGVGLHIRDEDTLRAF